MQVSAQARFGDYNMTETVCRQISCSLHEDLAFVKADNNERELHFKNCNQNS
jgi:hypothetical protein